MQACLSFITLDGGFDVPQHLLTGIADERTQCSDGISGVEVKDTEEILMLKVFAGVQTAAGHKGIGSADGGSIFECHPYVVVIILLKERIGKDVKNILAVIIPVFRYQLFRNALQLLTKVILIGNAVFLLQSRGHSCAVFLTVLPEVRSSGVLFTGSVRHIEHILELRCITAVVDEGDTLRTTPHIAAHLLVPEVIVSAGRGIRLLCVDHELLMEGILIEPCSGIKERKPVGKTAGDSPRGLVSHLGIEFQFTCHPHPPYRSRGTVQAPHIPHRS